MPNPAAHDDLYRVLGVPEDASADAIKRAYRARAREHHPDSGGDAEAFKRTRDAYEVLSDPARRARYDRRNEPRTGGPFVGSFWRNAATPTGATAGAAGAKPSAAAAKDLDLEDIFNDFSGVGGFGFGGAASTRAGRTPGRDAAAGSEPPRRRPTEAPRGARPGRPPVNVHVRPSAADPAPSADPSRGDAFGDLPTGGWRARGPASRAHDGPRAEGPRPRESRADPAPDVPGADDPPLPPRDPSAGADVHVLAHVPADIAERGGTVTVAYRRLRRAEDGRGFGPADELHDLRVPPGTPDGTRLRVPKLGDMGPGGPGDLVAAVRIVAARESGRMRMPPRSGPEAPREPTSSAGVSASEVAPQRIDVDVVDALLGGVVDVPTPSGPVRVRVPAGTSSGARFTLRGRGDGGADLIAEVRIVVPRELSDEARAAAERLAAALRRTT